MEKKLLKKITSWILIPEVLLHLHFRAPNPALKFIRNTCWSITKARYNSHFTNIMDRIANALLRSLKLLSLE